MATVIFIKESKQTPSAMRGCIRYCVQEKKTVDENGRQYVGGVNCLGTHAYEEFMATKNLYGKASGTYFYQYVQSFLPGEIQSYEEAHRIGLEFAGKSFPGYEVLVATHLDAHDDSGVQYGQAESGIQNGSQDNRGNTVSAGCLCDSEGGLERLSGMDKTGGSISTDTVSADRGADDKGRIAGIYGRDMERNPELGGGCDRKRAENGGEHCAESADTVESEQGAARTGWEDERAVYLRTRLEGKQSHRRIQGPAFEYEAVDHHGDCIDRRRFGDFKHGDLSLDEITAFFKNERQESDLPDDELSETDGWVKQKYDDLREQAELGNLYAGYRLSRILFDEDSPYYDEYDGAYYLESSAKQGYHMAQYRLGKMIYEGGYYRRVPENAAYWLTLSAKQKNPYAEMLLGQLYILGDFLRPDRKAGVDLLYDAIRHGNAHAAYTLGKYYADGKCLKKDIPKAIALLEQAAQMGDIYAEYRLAKIYLFESDCFDWQKAVEYLNTAAHKGNENAYRALQNMSRNTVISITTGIADLVGDLSAVFNERPAVEDCTTMPEHRERKKYEYEQSL